MARKSQKMIEIEQEIESLEKGFTPLNEAKKRLLDFKPEFGKNKMAIDQALDSLEYQAGELRKKVETARLRLELETIEHLASPEYSDDEIPAATTSN